MARNWCKYLLKFKTFWFVFGAFFVLAVFKYKKIDTNIIFVDDKNVITNDTLSSRNLDDNVWRFFEPYRFNGVYNGQNFSGQYFDSKWKTILESLNLVDFYQVDDKAVLLSVPVVVTGFSDNHYEEAERLMTKLNKVHGNRKLVYVYDLGLSENIKNQFKAKWNHTIIEFRAFNFTKYPEYVKNLFEYRWKPLIIAEMLNTVNSFWWLDTSVKMNGTVKTLYSIFANCSVRYNECPLYPWIMPDDASHSIFTTTDNRMSKFLPYPENLMKNYTMYGANLMLLYGTRNVRRDIVRNLVLCALEKDCMSPEGTTIYCNFVNGDRYGKFASCHRYDQSAVNILLGWANNFNIGRYVNNADNAFELY